MSPLTVTDIGGRADKFSEAQQLVPKALVPQQPAEFETQAVKDFREALMAGFSEITLLIGGVPKPWKKHKLFFKDAETTIVNEWEFEVATILCRMTPALRDILPNYGKAMIFVRAIIWVPRLSYQLH